MYRFMKMQSFVMSNTLYVVLHIPLVDESLQFHLFRLHNIPLFHPIIKRSFRYSIQEENLTIRSDEQYISSPLSTDIMTCQVLNGLFSALTHPCMQQILQMCAVMHNNVWAISTFQNNKKASPNFT